MKRKFVKVMFLGALTLAVGTSVTSCKDNDDDVKNLQEQIDNIKSTSPISSEEMKTAIAAAKTELEAEVKALKEALDGKANIAALEQEIASLKQQLEQADKDAAAAIAKSLADKETELKKLISANTKSLETLEKKIKELDSLKSRLDALEAAEKEYNATGSLDAYTKQAGLTEYINQKIVAALDGHSTIGAYIAEAVKAGTLADMSAIENAVAAITGKEGALTKLQEEFNKAMNGDENNKGILERLNTLETYSAAIDKFITDNDSYTKFSDVLDQIEESRSFLASLVLPQGNFSENVKAALKSELDAIDTRLDNLESDVKQHGIDIEAIKGMIQSIVYVPTTLSKSVEFKTLYAKKNATATNWSIISSSQAVEVKFRVSPASAAETFAANYDVTTDAQEIKVSTRSASIFSVDPESIKADDHNPGIITLLLKADAAATNYAICLRVTSKKAAESKTEVATEITSDYFAALKSDLYMSNAKYVSPQTKTELVYNDENTALDYLDGGHFEIKAAAQSTGTPNWIELKSLDLNQDLFKVAFTCSNTENFKIEDNKLMLKSWGQTSSIGLQSTVTANVSVVGIDNAFKNSYAPVKVVGKQGGLEPFEMPTVEWNGQNAETLVLTSAQMNAIYNEAELSPAAFNTLDASAFDFGTATDKVHFDFVDNTVNNNLKIVVPKGAGSGQAIVKIKVSDALTITVKANVTVNYMDASAVKLEKNSIMWNGANVNLPVGVDADKATKAVLGFTDVKTLFSNFSAINNKVQAKGGEIKFTATPNGVATVDATGLFSVDATKYKGGAITLTAAVMFGDHQVGDSYIANFDILENLTGKLSVPAADKRAIKIADKNSAQSLTDNFKWVDYRGAQMWPTMEATKFNVANAAKALGIYGLNVSYEFATDAVTKENAKMFTLANGAIKLKPEYASLESIAADIVVKVIVKATSPWGTVENASTELTVTLQKWAKPNN